MSILSLNSILLRAQCIHVELVCTRLYLLLTVLYTYTMKFKTVHLVTLSTVLLIHYTVALPSYPGVDVPRLLTLNPSRIVTEICTRVVSRFGRSRAKRDVTWYHTAESAVSLLLLIVIPAIDKIHGTISQLRLEKRLLIGNIPWTLPPWHATSTFSISASIDTFLGIDLLGWWL